MPTISNCFVKFCSTRSLAAASVVYNGDSHVDDDDDDLVLVVVVVVVVLFPFRVAIALDALHLRGPQLDGPSGPPQGTATRRTTAAPAGPPRPADPGDRL